MERIRNLNRYQKGILLLLLVLILAFTAVYSVSTSRVGFLYMDRILQPCEEAGDTVYSGTIRGVDSRFTVTASRTVTFQYGEKIYGPYTAKEDSTAIPEGNDLSPYMTGIEIYCGDELIFRGGILDFAGSNSNRLLFHEDGSSASITIRAAMHDGTVVDGDGNVVDPMEPSISTILELMKGPELTRKGEWSVWFLGVFVSIVTAVSILFADELFRWSLAFRIQDVDHAEPSEWELAGRYIGWTILPILALVVFVMGLQ